LIDSFFSASSMLEACLALEADGMHLRAILTQTETCLSRRTDALQRAREVIEAQRQRLEELELLNRNHAATA